MVWIRWECKTSNHELIGQLADDLGIRRAEAHGLYAATCGGFGDHQRDGMAAAVSRSTLERWGDWQGKPGKWAEAFLGRCLETEEGQRDPVGSIRGWWRQRKWLAQQARDNDRRTSGVEPGGNSVENPAETQPGSQPGAARVSDVDEDDDGNRNGNHPPSVGPPADPEADPMPGSAAVGRLIGAFVGRPDRWAVFRFIERCPEDQQVAWSQRLLGYLEGLGFPAGMQPTAAQLATACSDYSITPPNPVHFRAFVLRLMNGGPRRTGPRAPGDNTQEQLEAGRRWAARGG